MSETKEKGTKEGKPRPKGEEQGKPEEKASGKGKPQEHPERKPLCSTCGLKVESERVWVEFACPACRKERIIRCERCKRLENPYTCQACGFKGP